MSENMNEEMEYIEVETIDIELEDGTQVECAILDDFEIEGMKKYLALAPLGEDDVIDDSEIWFYSYTEDGEDLILDYIEDDEELKTVAAAYEDGLESDDAE